MQAKHGEEERRTLIPAFYLTGILVYINGCTPRFRQTDPTGTFRIGRDGDACNSSNQIEGPDRFIRYAVNVRFFTIQGSDDMLVDTLGMNTLFLPDLQYHFRGLDPNWVVNHAYNVASYLLTSGNEIDSGETVDGIKDGYMDRSIQWKCQYEDALIQPKRPVLDINTGEYAAGNRE